jgi:hypothetical protein
MINSTFNGWSVLALPNTPCFAQADFTMQDSVAADPSPWTRQTQILDWQVDWWEATASLPQMTRAQAQQWIAFLAELRGMSGAFLFGDPLARSPLGAAQGVPVVNGTNNSRSSVLNTRGWKPNFFRQLLPGDYLQIGQRLHINLEPVNSDSNGNASVRLWPRIREAPNDGDPVILHYPKGLFRLAENTRKYSISTVKLFGISVSLTEAL